VDKTLKCRECGVLFAFTAGEQAFYAEKGLLNEPQRCPHCRAARKAARGDTSPARVAHPTICARCNLPTTVPFVPRQDRPVYCSSCFERVRAEQRQAEAVHA
jgi:CxxC-x17-CxxC domain-containing protein